MRYAYQRGGSPILSWDRAPPQQSRAADAKSLGCAGMGSLEGSSLSDPTITMPLPRAGAPEPLPTLSGLGGVTATAGRAKRSKLARAAATRTPTKPLGDIGASSVLPLAAAGIAAYLIFRKRR